MDINEKVLAAFQTEHKEQIEGIRSLLSDLAENPWQPGDARLDDAFRLAHSLKGGARVCDLEPPETLGHQLESLLSSVRQGDLEWRSDVVTVVNLVLDSIEDWMAALADDAELPDTQDALTAIHGLISADTTHRSAPLTKPRHNLVNELRVAFVEEYAGHAHELRQFISQDMAPGGHSAMDREEAFRHAHGLRSAARAASLEKVEGLSQQLVNFTGQMRKDSAACDDTLRQSVVQLLDMLDDAVTQLPTIPRPLSPNPQEATPEICADLSAKENRGANLEIDADQEPMADHAISNRHESSTSSKPGDPPTRHKADDKSFANSETVRVDAESLDYLIRCSGQLLSELSDQDEMALELAQLRNDLAGMSRQRDSVRQSATASFRRYAGASEFNRVTQYFEAVARQLETLSRRAHSLQRIQGRQEWLLRRRGEQIHMHAQEARMVPVESIFQGFRKMVRDLGKDEGKQIEFTLRGLDQRADRLVLQALKDPLMHVLRNAVVHGIESRTQREQAGKTPTGTIDLTIETLGNRLRAQISDDGRGLDRQAIHDEVIRRGLLSKDDVSDEIRDLSDFVFQPGFTTSRQVSELAGRGMGLSVLRETVTRLQGDTCLHSEPGQGTRIELSIPLSVSTHRLVLARAGGHTYGIPASSIDQLLRVPLKQIMTLEGSPFITHMKEPLALLSLSSLLGNEAASWELEGSGLPVVVVNSGGKHCALGVDGLLAEREALIHELTGPAARVPYFSGAIHLGHGDIALVLNPAQLVGQSGNKSSQLPVAASTMAIEEQTPEILVVDDSFTTRTLEKSILEAHGYKVHIAVDGVEGLSLLRSQNVDLVIADVEMPRMTGFELLENVRTDTRLQRLPFILVTSRDKVEDRENGLNLGANAYIVKQKFDHENLLDTIQQML